MKFFAGIGSRTTPQKTIADMEQFGYLACKYIGLRSGAAPGADAAFERGCVNCNGPAEIFLPWQGFNGSRSTLFPPTEKAMEIAATIHPYFQHMKRPGKLLISRNMHQILGADLNTPVEFVICWTKDGCETSTGYTPSITGGTGSAIALASKLDIPVYNLYNPGRLLDAYEHLLQLTMEVASCTFVPKS